MGASLKSLRRFATLILGVHEPSAYFHQTLTFSPKERDYCEAKTKLERLLDNIHHRFNDATSIYVGEPHESGEYHFHVLFLFFDPVPRSLEKDLRRAVWGAWNSMQGGTLTRRANPFLDRREVFKDRQKTILYFSGGFDAPFRWWGSRNKALIQLHSSPVARKAVSAALAPLKPPSPVQPVPAKKPDAHPPFTVKELESLRELVEFHQKTSWEEFKKLEMGSKRKVTNAEFVDFKNGVKPKPIDFPPANWHKPKRYKKE